MYVEIDIDFPGGNIIVDEIDKFNITLRKDLRDTAADWFYWAFRCKFKLPGTYRFTITNGNACGPCGPACSMDGGITWQWLGSDVIATGNPAQNVFCYTHKEGMAESVIFCMGMQYQQIHLDMFLQRYGNAYISQHLLAHTRKGRAVERLHIEEYSGLEAKKYLLFTARHHCCEMMANYVLDGIMAAILSDDSLGRDFRRKYIVDVIPFVDKDGVVEGDQGKNRIPHDHARDYGQKEHLYPEIAAVEQLVLKTKPFFVMDIHCPWIRSGCNETVFFPGPEDKNAEQNMLRFSTILSRKAPEEMPHRRSDNVLYGTSWNTAENYVQGMALKSWAYSQVKPEFCSTLEVPYANARNQTLTPETCMKFGRAIVKSIIEFDSKRK